MCAFLEFIPFKFHLPDLETCLEFIVWFLMQLESNYACKCNLSKLNNSWRNLRNHESCNFILNCTGFPLLSGKSWLLFSILYREELLWNILRENIGLNLCKYNQLMSWKLRLVEYFFMTYIKCSIKWPTWRWTTASSLLLAGYFSHVSKVNITQQHCFTGSVWVWVAGTTWDHWGPGHCHGQCCPTEI